MTTITVTNRKGGTGKTTHATHLSAGLAAKGYRVALVDVDSQGSCSSTFQLPPEDGLYAALVRKQPLQDVVVEIAPEQYSTPDQPSKGALYLLQSSDLTFEIPFRISSSFVLLNLVNQMREVLSLDYVVMDTNPTLTGFDSAIGMASDAYIYVTEAERLSVDGIIQGIRQMMVVATDRQQHLKLPTVLLGVLPNKVRERTAAHQVMLEELHEHFGEKVWEHVPLSTTWAESSVMGQLVYTYAPTSLAAEYARKVTDTTLEGLATWLNETS